MSRADCIVWDCFRSPGDCMGIGEIKPWVSLQLGSLKQNSLFFFIYILVPACPHFSSISRAQGPHSFLEVFYYSNTVSVHARKPQITITFLVCRNESFLACVHTFWWCCIIGRPLWWHIAHTAKLSGAWCSYRPSPEPSSPLPTHTNIRQVEHTGGKHFHDCSIKTLNNA